MEAGLFSMSRMWSENMSEEKPRLKILVACEVSGKVRETFRKKGHDAWSCDIMLSDDNSEYHIQDDVLNRLNGWDIIIAFPPCTHLAVSGARWFEEKRKDGRQQKAIDFFMRIANADCPKIVIENPIGIMSEVWRKPDQIIQPWQFGHGETKATCLWLKGLPKLRPTNIVDGRENNVYKGCGYGWNTDECKKARSETYQGVADAMADQWPSKGVCDYAG